MSRRLALAVHVEHPVTHEAFLLLPGDEPVPKVAEIITNPFAWEPEAEPDPDDEDSDTGTGPETDPELDAVVEVKKPASRAKPAAK
ncbi:hypothetical protein [Streptacidiphilus cavernicola]|uniref:Uncharacterized protein n=1 Tax=Streptacidiphilus cavernicola TaxID=3342716 RepID=A0ABV6W231_9ACTN